MSDLGVFGRNIPTSCCTTVIFPKKKGEEGGWSSLWGVAMSKSLRKVVVQVDGVAAREREGGQHGLGKSRATRLVWYAFKGPRLR